VEGEGMPKARMKPVVLDDGQVALLTQISKATSEELRRVQRAKILLMACNGETDDSIATAVGLHKNSVRNTIGKFISMGLDAALSDLARAGRPVTIGDDAKAWVKSQACIKPKDLGYAQELWTLKKLTNHIHDTCVEAGHDVLAIVAPSKVWTILDEDELKPHRVRYFLERRDPDFDRKMNDILMVYKEVELQLAGERESNDIIVSYDEKPGIQAIANIASDLPPTSGHGYVSRDYEYKRLGTVSLLAGLNLITGEVVGLVRDTHKSSDFIDFLKVIDDKYADSDHIKIVLDNHVIHTSKETRKFLETRPGRFEFVFTPIHGSWLNLVESFFGKLSRVCLKGIRVKTKDELIRRIYQYLDEVNMEPVVYRWKFKMDEVEI
jgi:transposase